MEKKPVSARIKGGVGKIFKGKRKFIIVVVLIAALGVYAVFGMTPNEAAGYPVTTSTVERSSVEKVISIKGTVQGTEYAEVGSALNYEILSVLVEEGDYVKKGQVLATLDSSELQDQITSAQGAYDRAKLSVDDSLKTQQTNYEQAVRDLEMAKDTYETNRSLYEQGVITRDDYTKVENAYINAQAAVESYTVVDGKVTATGSDLKAIDIERDNLSQKRDTLDKTQIKSPIDGTVTRVNAKKGRYASDTENNGPMFVVEDLSNLQMNVKISENDISDIEVGQSVTITSDVTKDKTFEGVVSRISPTGEQKDGSSTEMVIPVQIDITENDGSLIAGVNARAKILVERSENTLIVPIDALMEDTQTGESFIYKVTAGDEGNHVLSKVEVTLGVEGDFSIEIKSGEVTEGDQIVLGPTYDMEDGMAVSLEGGDM